MKTVDEIQQKIAQLKARKAQLEALEKRRYTKQRRTADTTAKILAGAIVLRRFRAMSLRAAEYMTERDKMRYLDALLTLEIIDADEKNALLLQHPTAVN